MKKLWLTRDKCYAEIIKKYTLFTGNKPIRDVDGDWFSGGPPNNCRVVIEICINEFHDIIGNIPRLRKGQCIEIKSIKFTLPKKKGK